MPIIIDGHNLIPKIPGLDLSMLDDEEKLIKILVNYCRVTRKKLTIFFDNAPPGTEKSKRYGFLEVYFIREGRSADSAIISMLNGLGKRAKNWTVVSSDSDLQMSAMSLGARVISSEEFATMLLRASNEYGESKDLQNENYPDDGEVKQWLEIFGEEKPDEM